MKEPPEAGSTPEAGSAPEAGHPEAGHPEIEAQCDLRVAVAAARLGLWRADLKNHTVVTKQFGGPLTGLPEDAQPRTLDDFTALVHPEDRESVGRMIAQAMAGEREYNIDFRIIRPDGPVRWVHAQGDVVRDATEEPVALVGVDMDITDRKLAEKERLQMEARLQHAQRLESLGVLAGGIAHDFNNLLVGILGNADLVLLDLPHDSPMRQRVEDIRTAGIRASELTGQMLAYSGKGRFVVERLDLNALIREMSQLLRVAASTDSALRYDLTPGLPWIEADATQIRQVVMNLITNASEAIGERSGLISVTTGAIDADRRYLVDVIGAEDLGPGRYVFLEVSDNGCGMDEATQQRIFDPFFTTKFTGRGLGLAGVLGIVRGHGGALRVYSEVGRGTTFKVLLPAARGAESAPGEERREDGAAWTGSGLVLVVDDDPVVRNVITAALERAGFRVIAAADGVAGVEAFRQHTGEIVLVLLDLTMPRQSGEQTFGELRRIRPEVWVVLMSGYNEVDVTNRFVGKGLAGFLQKPFRVGALLDLVRSILAGRVKA